MIMMPPEQLPFSPGLFLRQPGDHQPDLGFLLWTTEQHDPCLQEHILQRLWKSLSSVHSKEGEWNRRDGRGR